MYITDVSDQWALGLPGPAHGTPTRSAGLHMSDLIRAAAIDTGMFEPDDETAAIPEGEQFPQPALNRMCAGLAWEDWLAKRYAGVITFHPGEVWLDGVAGSPDGISFPGGDTTDCHVHEFKFTWKSTNTPLRKSWYWVSQLQAYLKAMRCTGAFLHTYHVMGNYRGSGPIYRVIHFRFNERELEENWNTLLGYRAAVELAAQNK